MQVDAGCFARRCAHAGRVRRRSYTGRDDVLKAFDDANTGEVFAVFGDLKNYAVNSNLQMTAVKWTDNDNNKVKNKVIMICDGKVLDPNGFLILKKKA